MPNTAQDPLTNTILNERYVIKTRIARGGMSTVYLAHDNRLERDVAIKIMHPHLSENPQFVTKFKREAKTAAKLSHPNIVNVLDQGVDTQQNLHITYLVMEYVPGTTLRKIISEHKTLSPQTTFKFILPILEGLTAAHNANLIHRDIKPENVLITPDGRIKIGDFGLSRTTTSNTTTGSLVGTVAYLSPELVTRGVTDIRSDIYAIGIMIFEMLTGKPPYTGDVPIQVAFSHVNETVPKPSTKIAGISPQIDELIAWTTAQKPQDRPNNTQELSQKILEILESTNSTQTEKFSPTATLDKNLTQLIAQKNLNETIILPKKVANTSILTKPTTLTKQNKKKQNKKYKISLIVIIIIALIATTVGWYLAAGPGAKIKVPDILNSNSQQATQKLTEIGLTPIIQEIYSETTENGLVDSTQPETNQRVKKKGEVIVNISKGPQLFTIPNLYNLNQNTAQAVLKTENLNLGEITQIYNNTIPEGNIIEQNPQPDTQHRRNTNVNITVSLGKQPVTLPNLVGTTEQQSNATLKELVLSPNISYIYNNNIPAGNVISQSPEPATTLYQNDTVNLTISLGPEIVEIPNLFRKSSEEARNILESLGLKVEISTPTGGLLGIVTGQNPSGGEKVPKGTSVTLIVV